MEVRMCQVNVLQAKTELSKLILMLEEGKEDEIVIARNGQPVVTMHLFEDGDTTKRIGCASGRFACTPEFEEAFDESDAEVARLFGV